MSWYAIYTKSRCEEKVYQGLLQRDLEPFLPKMEVWSRRTDRRKKIQIPLFSGYLFVDLPGMDGDTRLSILKTPGVVKLLGKPVGNEPVPIPDTQIDAIRRLVDSKVEIQSCIYPRVGERARITTGAFKGIEGVVLQTDYEKNLFVVSIDLLQRSVAIRLEGFQVERI